MIGVVGDASLGRERGFTARGWLYVPGPAEPAQAIAVGLGGSQGSTFFSPSPAVSSGYESGYFLVYENRPGVALADGRPDHPGVWEWVHASHDNMDGAPVSLIASATNGELEVTPGTWVRFALTLEHLAGSSAARLAARLGGRTLSDGAPPPGGPRAGAFQVGFRENHPGAPAPAEGTWLDGLELAWTRAAKVRPAPLATGPVEALAHDADRADPVLPPPKPPSCQKRERIE